MSTCNNLFVKQPERIECSSDITQIANNDTQLYLEDNNVSHDLLIEMPSNNPIQINFLFCRTYPIRSFSRQRPHMCNLYKEESLKGNSELQIILASCYCYEKWVEKDEYKAFNYYQKLAEMDDSYGMYFVDVCHDNGIGVEKDEHKAFIYYQKSAEMGNISGTNTVGYCYRNGK
ncbi:hypothetical protein C2G38_2155061 [Gigaspora rosea]|uniref:HCP-like protein n=1 Tax=Gigaspora rosea TaxID=44941 RepID=A0A397W4D3_9GLOM|nr:hypothetical protein C2G38_2155061 [Gigaspora rosea]